MPDERARTIRRMLQEFDYQISGMNSTAITDIAGDIKKSDFLDLAHSISILRAKYLSDILVIARAGENDLTQDKCTELRQTRMNYEEAKEAYSALKRALELGYFNLANS